MEQHVRMMHELHPDAHVDVEIYESHVYPDTLRVTEYVGNEDTPIGTYYHVPIP
jgi:hypothetical protein